MKTMMFFDGFIKYLLVNSNLYLWEIASGKWDVIQNGKRQTRDIQKFSKILCEDLREIQISSRNETFFVLNSAQN